MEKKTGLTHQALQPTRNKINYDTRNFKLPNFFYFVTQHLPARSCHAATAVCEQAINADTQKQVATQEVAQTLDNTTKSTPLAAKKVAKKKEEFAVYKHPKAGRYTVRNLDKATSYTVQFFGDGIISCSCPHHQARSQSNGFVDKHIDAVEQALFLNQKIEREPVTLQPAPLIGKQMYYAYIGNKYLGLVSDDKRANIMADAWFKTEATIDKRNKAVVDG